jgi:hypothetical protein
VQLLHFFNSHQPKRQAGFRGSSTFTHEELWGRYSEKKSSPYTGSTEAANQYLHRTYVRPLPSLDECTRARRIFDACNWTNPTESQSSLLNRPPSKEEIEIKLRRAINTSPGADEIEYHHIKALDPQCRLLEIIYQKVWQIGIPDAWRRSRTVPIFKKGDPSDFSNFRPISLLSTLYKISSGILSQRITAVAELIPEFFALGDLYLDNNVSLLNLYFPSCLCLAQLLPLILRDPNIGPVFSQCYTF